MGERKKKVAFVGFTHWVKTVTNSCPLETHVDSRSGKESEWSRSALPRNLGGAFRLDFYYDL